MLKIIAVMAGGGLGASLRYGIFQLVQKLAGPAFPSGTLAANLLGSLLIGILWSFFEGSRLTNEMRLFIFTGFLGGFTTFSTFTRETTQLFKIGEWKTAVMYVMISNIVGILLVFAGYFATRRWLLST